MSNLVRVTKHTSMKETLPQNAWWLWVRERLPSVSSTSLSFPYLKYSRLPVEIIKRG